MSLRRQSTPFLYPFVLPDGQTTDRQNTKKLLKPLLSSESHTAMTADTIRQDLVDYARITRQEAQAMRRADLRREFEACEVVAYLYRRLGNVTKGRAVVARMKAISQELGE
jgi:hypothetical protein